MAKEKSRQDLQKSPKLGFISGSGNTFLVLSHPVISPNRLFIRLMTSSKGLSVCVFGNVVINFGKLSSKRQYKAKLELNGTFNVNIKNSQINRIVKTRHGGWVGIGINNVQTHLVPKVPSSNSARGVFIN